MSLGRILVVDDDPGVRMAIRWTLTKAGYEVIEAEDGAQGIEAMKVGDNPLVVRTIMCDVQMPKVNGMEAIAFFRSQFPHIPLVVMTAQPDLVGATQLFEQGEVDYLPKPVAPHKLTELVNKLTSAHAVDRRGKP